MKIRIIAIVVVILVLVAGVAIWHNSNDNGDTVSSTEEAEAQSSNDAEDSTPTLTEMCEEIDRREAQIHNDYRTAVADISEAEDVDDALTKAAEDRDNALKALEADKSACERISNPNPGDTDSNDADVPTEDSNPVHYYASDTPGVEFGPAAPEDVVNNAVRELYIRLDPNAPGREGGDPALTVATAEGLGLWREMTEAERLERTNYLATHPEAWALVRTGIHMYIDEQLALGNVTFGDYSGRYITMDMFDGADGVPVIRDTSVTATFRYLNIGGYWLKLNCGYQPVRPIQAPTPERPHEPTPGQPTTPVTYSPPGETPPNEVKDPSESTLVNPLVPNQPQGPGTTPIGTNPGPVTPEPTPEDDVNDDGFPDSEQPSETPSDPSDDSSDPVNDDVVPGPATG